MDGVRSLSTRVALLTALSLFAVSNSRAQETKEEEAIRVIGHYENAIGTSDAASQGAITPGLIESRPVSRPAEVLEYVPGLIITQHSGDGKANQYFLRGFNLDHGTDFRTSVAGIPVNMPTHAHGQGYSDLNFLIPELVSRIDYLKGPYFAEIGDFGSAGAADIGYYTRMPKNIASVSLGSFGYKRALLAGSPQVADGVWLYGLELLRNNGPWDNPSDYRKVNGVLRYSRGTNADGITLSAMAYTGKWNATDQIPQRAVDAGLVRRLGALDATDGGDTSRYSLSFDRHKAFDNGTFHLDSYLLKYRLSLFSNFTFFKDDPVNGDQFQQFDERTVFGLEPKWVINHKIAGMTSVSKLGFQYRRDNIARVGLYNSAARQRLGTVREDSVRQTGMGAFYENALQWTDWLKTVAGLRSDLYRAEVRSDLAANSGIGKGGITSPKINFIFGPWAETEYFLNFGQGFHSNDARGTTIAVNPRSGAAAVRVPPLVKTRGNEIGVRSELLPHLQSSLALWRLKLDSELLFVGDAGSTEASRPSLRRGVEWSNRYTPHSRLLIDVDLSASKANFTNDDPAGNRIPGAIDRVASLGVALKDLGRWSASAHLRYFGPRPLLDDNSQKSLSSTVVSMRGSYKVDPKMRIDLDVFNLFNRKVSDIDYFYCSRVRSDPAGATCRDGSNGVDGVHSHPAEPRSFRISLTTNF